MITIAFIYLGIIFNACLSKNSALGCDADPIPLVGLPFFFGIFNTVATALSSLIIATFSFALSKVPIFERVSLAVSPYKRLVLIPVIVFTIIVSMTSISSWKQTTQRWETYTDSKYGFQMSYPPVQGTPLYEVTKWYASPGAVDVHYRVLFFRVTSSRESAGANIDVMVYPQSVDSQIIGRYSFWRERDIAQFTSAIKYDKSKSKEAQVLEILKDIMDWKKIEYHQSDTEFAHLPAKKLLFHENDLTNQLFIFPNKNEIYIIQTSIYSSNSDDIKTTEEMLETFHFTD